MKNISTPPGIYAYWYVHGYNDNRHPSQPYVSPQEFAVRWEELAQQPSRPSLQDAFRSFREETTT